MSERDGTSSAPSSSRRRKWLVAALIAAILAAAVVVLVRSWPSEPTAVARPTPSASPTPTPSPSPTRGPCEEKVEGPFTPKRISIRGIVRNAQVIALPRDGNNVPGVPPTSAKQVIAWDRPPGIQPGEAKGNVLINAHTWPDGSALGNKFLRKLKVGQRIIVRNRDVALCYEVDKEIEVLAADGYPPYFDREGPHQLALLVCSGRRLGPGNWTHRTIWFATPVAS